MQAARTTLFSVVSGTTAVLVLALELSVMLTSCLKLNAPNFKG
jgi:hypothetical protein